MTLRMPITGPVVYLADCSEFQPDINDPVYLRWSKAIIIRAAYGDQHVDHAWYGGARRADLHAAGIEFLGIYQYLVSSQSGASQAQAFHSLVGAIQPGEVFVADFEEGDHQMLTAWYNEMITLYGAGIDPYLWTYTGLSFGSANGASNAQWIAAYGQSEPKGPHKLWQFTDSLAVPGVGTSDCSLFHGTMAELAALAYKG
jgi:GH25 family lysozyme M1 (1,4-beta-N-acetylmuramidase)